MRNDGKVYSLSVLYAEGRTEIVGVYESRRGAETMENNFRSLDCVYYQSIPAPEYTITQHELQR